MSGKQTQRIALVVGHQRSAQGAINRELKLTEWAFNSRAVEEVAALLRGTCEPVIFAPDVKNWEKCPIINKDHQRDPFAAVIEFHLNCVAQAPKVNYSLIKYPAGCERAKVLSIFLIKEFVALGVPAANWAETSPKGVFPTDKMPPKDKRTPEWERKYGWKFRGAAFLWGCKAPTIILEPFFVSCTDFAKKMNSPEGITAFSAGIARGITAFLNDQPG